MFSVGVIGVRLFLNVPSHWQIYWQWFVGADKVYEHSASSEVMIGASVPILEHRFVLQYPSMYLPFLPLASVPFTLWSLIYHGSKWFTY